MQNSDSDTILIIGAGIAGLIAAIELQRAGRSVRVLEAAPEVGGRVRTTSRDGFQFDHGFQVLFTAYPSLNQYLDHASLQLRPFLPAAQLVRGDGRRALIGDALRAPSLLLPSLTNGAIPVADVWRLLQLRRFATSLDVNECFESRFTQTSTREFLQQRGFSASTIDGFFAPFYGGILLDRTLSTRASVLLFTFKMLAEGETAVPSLGMGAIPAQLAQHLLPNTLACDTRVRALRSESGRACGVVLDDGTTLSSSAVVLATDLVAAHALAKTVGCSLDEPRSVLGCTTLYYRSDASTLPGRALWLNAVPNGTVSHAITMTEVAPSYAPAGQHLLAATVLGEAATRADETLDRETRADLSRMTGRSLHAAHELLAVWRVPMSQFAQPVGGNVAAKPQTALSGLYRASEVMHSSSLEGAARGGQMAARALTTDTALVR